MASTYIYRASGTPTSTRKFTFSFWVKKSGQGADQFIVSSFTDANNRLHCAFDSNDRFDFIAKVSGSNIIRTNPDMLFRDPSAWYHIVLNVDTTQSTAADRSKVYVNGVEQTEFGSGNKSNPSQNADVNISGDHFIGAYDNSGSPSLFLNGCLAHVHYTDGYTYSASTFGETDSTSGIWKPKTAPSVTYGTNGFFLKFGNSGNLDLDSSGNNLSFTTAGTLTQNVDTPSNNFCTMNPLDNYFAGGTFSNGNNTVQTRNTGYSYNTSTMGVSAGKWYWEMKYASLDVGSGNQLMPGIAKSLTRGTTDHMGYRNTSYAYTSNGVMFNNNGTTSYGNTYAPNDIVGFALDLTNNKFYASINGTWQNSANPATNTGGHSITAPDAVSSTDLGFYFIAVGDGNDGFQATVQYNFGQGFFGTTAVASANADANGHGKMEYAVPSGYYTLNTKNLKEFG